jgi:hypothetical protein
MHVQILRPISGLDAGVGDVVDTSTWAPDRIRVLMKQRRCVPVMAPAASTTDKRGRRYEEALSR